MRSSHSLDRFGTPFDGTQLVADAGLLLPATLAQHLGLRNWSKSTSTNGDRPGRANVGDKLLTLVMSALAGGDCIDDVAAPRAGGTGSVLGFRVKAARRSGPSCGLPLGHVRQLDAFSRICSPGPWRRAPSTTGIPGCAAYHPLLAVAAGTGECSRRACARAGPTPSGTPPSSCARRSAGLPRSSLLSDRYGS